MVSPHTGQSLHMVALARGLATRPGRVLAVLGQVLARLLQARRARLARAARCAQIRRTEAIVSALPEHLRRDVDWPAAHRRMLEALEDD